MNEARQAFEQALADDWKRHPKTTQLHIAVEYALRSGGKRFRPMVVMAIAEGIGLNHDVMPAALAVEYFHTASLIADDLPCMDDDVLRRGKPSLHVAFDETTALLSSYALICAAFEQIHMNAKLVGDREGMLALEQASKAAGVNGATCGQYLDLYPPGKDLDTLLEVLRLKTVTLFETAYVLGWLFGGGSEDQLPIVRSAAEHFGLAFQIADDLGDYDQDCDRLGSPNIAFEMGIEKASTLFEENLQSYDQCLKDLRLDGGGLRFLRTALMDHLAASSF